jgi:hypothetical protein
LTGREYVDQYLLPLAETDLLHDSLRLHTRVLAVGRCGMFKDQPIGSDAREGAEFELLVEDGAGQRRVTADVVLDATGTFRTPRWMGGGGLPAINEIECQTAIRYHLPDILGSERNTFAARRSLLVGSGHSAATAVVALAELAQTNTATEVIWVTRRQSANPIQHQPEDSLPARATLAERANRLAGGAHRSIRLVRGAQVHRIQKLDPSGFEVELNIEGQPEVLRVDQLLALVGYRPDNQIVAELQVHQCYATEGPMNVAASLLAHPSSDCLTQPQPTAESLTTTEPGYFVLGSKSYGRIPHFLIATGLQQIRRTFSTLADRRDLDLYANMQHLLP